MLQGQADSLLSIQAKLFICKFLIDSHFPKLLLVEHQIKKILPASVLSGVAFSSAWGTVLGVSSSFLENQGLGGNSRLVQESLCLLTILSSYCKFISVTCNPWLMSNQLLFPNFGENCFPWRWKSLPWEKRKGTIIIIFTVCVYCWPFFLVAAVK